MKGARIPAKATPLLTQLFFLFFFFVCFFIAICASWIEFKSKLIAVGAIPKELRIALKSFIACYVYFYVVTVS